MKTVISTAALIAAISMTPALAAANNYSALNGAHERCKSDEDKRQVLGGLAGAVVGGVVGSQVSGNGARTEGSAIGAVIGGLAGAGIADKTVDCDPVYSQANSHSYETSRSYGHTAIEPAQTTHYGSSTYGASTQSVSEPYYEDRITVSTHPVYSNPSYGARTVSPRTTYQGNTYQGRTYTAGTASYPSSGQNSQYVTRTYQAAPIVHAQPAQTTTRYYSHSQPTTQRIVYSSPQQPSYTQPQTYRTATPYTAPSRSHYHGRYSCEMGH
ncbi:MAG: glycine zipper 2TM domain-containing protein [Hellea sp.]